MNKNLTIILAVLGVVIFLCMGLVIAYLLLSMGGGIIEDASVPIVVVPPTETLTPTETPTLTETPTPTETLIPTETPTITPYPNTFTISGVKFTVISVEIKEGKTDIGTAGDMTPHEGRAVAVLEMRYSGDVSKLLQSGGVLQGTDGLYIQDKNGYTTTWQLCYNNKTTQRIIFGFFVMKDTSPYTLKSGVGGGVELDLSPFIK